MPDTPWPPPRLAVVLPKMREWSAWLGGDPVQLASVYGGDAGTAALRAIAPSKRTILSGLRDRMFWGNRPQTTDQPAPHRVHIPLAPDLATASATLMFGSPPTVTAPGDTSGVVAETMTHLIEERALWETCTSAFTVGAGLGGTYLRASWDPTIQGGAFLSYVDADQASPVFGPYGDLVEVTFHRVLEATSTHQVTVYRHFERHYLSTGETVWGGVVQPVGTGLVEHTLWVGTHDNVGRQTTFDKHPDMFGFAAYPGAEPFRLTVTTGSPGLAVEYVKNKAEQLAWRHDPVGSRLGRSDFDQLEPSFDMHDRLWSYLAREFDLTKARAFVPSSLLRSLGPGAGASFDMDREFFTPLEIPPAMGATLDQQMSLSNFPIRVDEHINAIKEIQQSILRDAGYSARTFGEDENGSAMTATEVIDRNSRSGQTRNTKCNLAGPAIRRVLVKVMQINQTLLGVGQANTDDLTLTWPQSDTDTPQNRATTVEMLDRAGAISLWMKLTIAHPGVDQDDLLLEYRRIRAEGMANPDQVGGVAVLDPFNPDADPVAEAEEITAGAEDPAALKAKADAFGVLVRGGVDQAASAELVGLGGVKLSGGIPTSLRPAAADAAGLEDA